jgi:hypothetical protein
MAARSVPQTHDQRHRILMRIAAREYRQLWRLHHDDVSQIADIVIWQHPDWLECRRALHRELWRLGRSFGYNQYIQTNTIDNPETLPCSVADCGKPGVYVDPDWGRLCRTHGMAVRGRRKRGTAVDRPLRTIRAEHGIPRRNRELWRSIRIHVGPDQWNALWAWGAGRVAARPRTAIEAARQAIGLTT